MSKTPLLSTGLSGLVGSKFHQMYQDEYDFLNLDISSDDPTDITDSNQVMKRFESSNAESIVHLAAYTDVTKAWEQRGDKEGLAYQVNVVGTQNIVKAAQAYHKHIIHISTAFVFDGNKSDLYTEADTPSPIEWYGQTKAESEVIVQESECDWTILRIDFPFRSDPFPRPDIARKTYAAIQKGIPLFDNHFFGPTFIDDFAHVLNWTIATKTTGLFHASSGEQWSDYQFGAAILEAAGEESTLQRGDLDEYLKNLNRPYQRNTAMASAKLQKASSLSFTSIPDALAQITLEH